MSVVYFRAQRGGINAEWFLPGNNTPKYTMALELLDRNCHAFFSSGNAPGWHPAKRGVLSPLSADEVEPHQADMRLTGATLAALRAAPLSPEMSPEFEALAIPGTFFGSLPAPPASSGKLRPLSPSLGHALPYSGR